MGMGAVLAGVAVVVNVGILGMAMLLGMFVDVFMGVGVGVFMGVD